MHALAPSKTLVEKTYEAILEAICTGRLPPGDRLNQDDIAERLQVSRQPVNSAIAMLKAQRFVTDAGRRGVVVAPVDETLFGSIYEFRSAIEPLAVTLAMANLDNPAIAEGRRIVTFGKAKVRMGDDAGVLQADIDFHAHIYALSRNHIVVDTMRLNWQHLRRSMGRVLQHPGMSVQVWDEHERIFEAMARGEAGVAADLMRSHVIEAPRRLRSG